MLKIVSQNITNQLEIWDQAFLINMTYFEKYLGPFE